MRITNGNAAGKIGKSGGKARTSGSSSSFVVPSETGQAKQSQGTVSSGNVQDVSALLALQGIEDAMHGKKRKAIRRGNRMLDLLENVRLGLLSGSMPLAVLEQLERLADETELSGDERIDELLSEIGLRAQVEIAKLEARSA